MRDPGMGRRALRAGQSFGTALAQGLNKKFFDLEYLRSELAFFNCKFASLRFFCVQPPILKTAISGFTHPWAILARCSEKHVLHVWPAGVAHKSPRVKN